MTLQLKPLSQWSLFLAPIAISSMIADSPAIAATFAASSAQVDISGFSQNPTTIGTFRSTDTQALGNAEALAAATATFQVDYQNRNLTQAANQTESLAQGTGRSNYSGLAVSFAEVIGQTFLVKAGDPFALKFKALLNLAVATDGAPQESATVDGTIALGIFNQQEGQLLDSFSLFSSLGTQDSARLELKNTAAFTVNANVNALLGGLDKSTTITVDGQYARVFDQNISLTLIERKESRAAVEVPEPHSAALLLVFFAAIGRFGLKQRTSVE